MKKELPSLKEQIVLMSYLLELRADEGSIIRLDCEMPL